MEATSKKIMGLQPVDVKQPSDKQLKLQLSVRAYTVSYIQERSIELPKLPDESEFKTLISQREEQRKIKLEKQLKQTQVCTVDFLTCGMSSLQLQRML